MITNNRLLIVDDEADVRALFSDIAEECGYVVAEASNRDQFVAVYHDFEPTLVLLDLTMPGGDGVELLRDMAALGCRARIVLASGQDRRVLTTAERLGRSVGLTMHTALQKPIAVTELEEVLEHVRSTAPIISSAVATKPTAETAPLSAAELSTAIDAGQMEPYFQPKIGLAGHDDFPVIGAEALVRWNHPERGLVPPDHFIPIAEKAGLMGKLTDAVLERTIAHLQSWSAAGIALPVSVNISPTQLTDLTLPDRIADLLVAAGLDPALLIIEVTEQAAMADIGVATDILTRLRLKNIAVSLDDFGAGYSSLVEIYRLPLSELKFDRSLITDLDHDKDARTVVSALVPLARALDLTVCAEGIETLETARFLKSIGCHKAQGYHFSRPLPANEYARFIADAQQTAGSPGSVLSVVR